MTKHNKNAIKTSASLDDLTTINDDFVEETRCAPPSRAAKIVKTLGSLLYNRNMSDVTFEVEGKKVPAHRLMLAARSAVFEAMLYGPMKATQSVIPLPNVSWVTFQAILTYVYTDEISIDNGNVIEILLFANQYELTLLETMCEEIVKKATAFTDVFKFLEQLHSMTAFIPLQNHMLEFIVGWFQSNTPSMNVFSPLTNSDVLDVILAKLVNTSRYIGNDYRVRLFEMLLVWAKKQCIREDLDLDGINIRQELNGMEARLEFEKMNKEQFAVCLSKCPLFFKREELAKIQLEINVV